MWRQVGLAGQDAQRRFHQALAATFGRGQRQVEVEGGAGAGHAGEGDRAAVQPDQFVGDAQPQAEAFRGRRGRSAVMKARKDVLLLLQRDAAARVVDPQVQMRGGGQSAQRDMALLRKLVCVAQQIEQDLPQALRITANLGQRLRQFQPPFDFGAGRQAARHRLEDVFQKCVDCDRLGENVQVVDLGPGEVQQVVDEPAQVFAALIEVAPGRAAAQVADRPRRGWVTPERIGCSPG